MYKQDENWKCSVSVLMDIKSGIVWEDYWFFKEIGNFIGY